MPTSKIVLKRIRYLTLALSGVLIVYFLGSHEPVFFGWQFYLLGIGLIMTLVMGTFLYLTLVISSALYQINNRKSLLPPKGQALIYCGIILATGIQIFSVTLVLITDKFSWNAYRHMALAFAILLGGSYFNYSLHRLRKIIFDSRQNLATKMSTEKKRNDFSSQQAKAIRSQDSPRASPKHPNDGPVNGNSPQISIAPSTQPLTFHQGSLHESKLSHAPKQQLLRTSSTASTKRTSQRSTPQQSREATQSPNDGNFGKSLETKVIRKMCFMLIIAYTVLPVAFFISVLSFIFQIQTTKSYSETVEIENGKYEPLYDVFAGAAILACYLFLYYSQGK